VCSTGRVQGARVCSAPTVTRLPQLCGGETSTENRSATRVDSTSNCTAYVTLKFHASSFLVASSRTRPTRATSWRGRGCAPRVSGVSEGRRLHRSACHALIGRPTICCGVVLPVPVCPCVVSFSKVSERDTHDLLRTSSYSILVASLSDTFDTSDFLVT